MGRDGNPVQDRIRLLLAADSQLLLEMESSFFPENEFEIILAHNGCEAFNLVKAFEPAAVFLDLFMPQLNGEECCRLIKSDLRLHNTRVVLVSPDDERHLRRCHAARSDLVVTKPVRRCNFIAVVAGLVGAMRRAPPRWPVRLAARLCEDGHCRLATWTVNLSERGAYLEGTVMPPAEKHYTLHLQVSAHETLTLAARIAWYNAGAAPRDPALPAGFGVQFLALKGETRLRLRRLLDEFAPCNDDSLPGRTTASPLFVELPMVTGKRL